MEIQAVGPASTSSARSVMMEIWRMSMVQRTQLELRQRIFGQKTERCDEQRKVDPAVRILISPDAKLMAEINSTKKSSKNNR